MDYNTALNLNSIIHQIYNVEDFNEMKKTIITLIRSLIPCTCGSILMTKGGNRQVFCDPVTVPESYEDIEREYIKCQDMDGSLWVVRRKQSTVFRDTDLMPDETREQTEYYQKCFRPFGIHYSVDLTITNGQKIMGIMTLYRTKGEGDFTTDEMRILQLLSMHLDARFSKSLKAADAAPAKAQIARFAKDYCLTARETEVLQLVLKNCDNREIAEDLCISENTLKKHLQNLYKKADVSSRVQLIALARSAM